jgi:hypothetical protein
VLDGRFFAPNIIYYYSMNSYGIKVSPIKCHIYCLSHIINLTLPAYLFAEYKTALRKAINQSIEEGGDVTVCELLIESLKDSKGKKKVHGDHAGWCSIGTLVNFINNIIVYISVSSILTDCCRTLLPTILGLDNVTRWNSWYILIKCAIERQAEIELMCTRDMGQIEWQW